MATRQPARRSKAVTQDDLLAAISTLNASADERGIMKHAPGIIVAILLGLIFWVGATLLSLNNTVTRMSANVDQLSKSIGDLQAGQGSATGAIGDLKASVARQDARSNAIEADINRIKERTRMLEGQRPLKLDGVQ